MRYTTITYLGFHRALQMIFNIELKVISVFVNNIRPPVMSFFLTTVFAFETPRILWYSRIKNCILSSAYKNNTNLSLIICMMYFLFSLHIKHIVLLPVLIRVKLHKLFLKFLLQQNVKSLKSKGCILPGHKKII